MSVLANYLTAIAGLTVISILWFAVQRLWLGSFAQHGGDEADALAGRGDCHGCSCETIGCERDPASTIQQQEEGTDHAP